MSVLLSISKTYTGLQRKVTRVLLAYSLYRRTVIKEIGYSRFHIQAHPIAYVILGTDSTHDRKLYRFHSLTLSTNLAIHTFFNGTPRRNIHRKVLCIHKVPVGPYRNANIMQLLAYLFRAALIPYVRSKIGIRQPAFHREALRQVFPHRNSQTEPLFVVYIRNFLFASLQIGHTILKNQFLPVGNSNNAIGRRG